MLLSRSLYPGEDMQPLRQTPVPCKTKDRAEEPQFDRRDQTISWPFERKA
jgi:hypothetical protein